MYDTIRYDVVGRELYHMGDSPPCAKAKGKNEKGM